MVPETTSIDVRGDTAYWENTTFNVSVAQAEAIADEVRDAMGRSATNAVLVDNEEASGTWPQEVNEIWEELMADMYDADLTCATISPEFTNAMHINRLSKGNDTYDRIRAFKPDERDEALSFVE